MTGDRKCGLALIVGTAGLLVVMMFHPTGGDLLTSGQLESMVRRNIAVHSLALACVPVMFLGALGLYRRLSPPDRLSVSGLVLYAFAVVAAMNAAIASGFGGSYLLEKIRSADAASSPPSTSSVVWRALAGYNFRVNQGFALVFIVASSVAILLWSIAILRKGAFSGGLGIYGCILGAFGVLGVLSGHSMSSVHGFGGLVMLSQATCYVAVGVRLLNSKTAV